MMVRLSDLAALTPLVVLGGSTVAVMLMIALRRNYNAAVMLTLIGLVASFRSLWATKQHLPRQVTPLLLMDQYAVFYIGLIIAAALAIVLISYDYFKRTEGDNEEFYILLSAATLGASVLRPESSTWCWPRSRRHSCCLAWRLSIWQRGRWNSAGWPRS